MAELPSFDPYFILGLDKLADSAAIKKAYRKLALIKHPDKCTDDTLKQSRTDEFQLLNEAYDILGDDEKRKRHDALVKLESLRKEKAAMAGPRGFARSNTYSFGNTGTAYTSRGATNVEDRAPRSSYDDDQYSSRYDYDNTYFRRPSGTSTRTAREEDRRRAERRRDNDVKAARATKYEDSDYYSERATRDSRESRPSRESREPRLTPEDDSREKYNSWEEHLKSYTTGSTRDSDSRPKVSRAPSSREVPRYAFATRSRATAKDRKSSRDDTEDLAQKVRSNQEKLKNLQEQEEERERRNEQRRREDAMERQREIERREREREREELERQQKRKQQEEADKEQRRRLREERDRVHEEAEARDRASREREKERERERERERQAPRSRNKENVEPYERRPPILQHTHSSPPVFQELNLPTRVKTEPLPSPSVPTFSRSRTMPAATGSNTSAKRTNTSSKLRETTIQPDDYSSASEVASEKASSSRPTKSAKPVKRIYKYSREDEDGKPARPYIVEPRAQTSTSSSRRRSPSAERPSSKMGRGTSYSTTRPGTSSGQSYSSPRTAAPRTRSPERSSRRETRERERGREYDRDDYRDYQARSSKPFYGERSYTAQSPSYDAKDVAWAPPITRDSVSYSRPSTSRRTEKDPYGYTSSMPRFERRSSHMHPLSSMS